MCLLKYWGLSGAEVCKTHVNLEDLVKILRIKFTALRTRWERREMPRRVSRVLRQPGRSRGTRYPGWGRFRSQSPDVKKSTSEPPAAIREHLICDSSGFEPQVERDIDKVAPVMLPTHFHARIQTFDEVVCTKNVTLKHEIQQWTLRALCSLRLIPPHANNQPKWHIVQEYL